MPAFSSSSLLSSYRVVKPSKATLNPEALNRYFPALMVAWVVFMTQFAIWQAMNRSQISLYNLYWSEVRELFTWSGVRLMVEGRMASWPSWAFARDLKCLGFEGRYLLPHRSSI